MSIAPRQVFRIAALAAFTLCAALAAARAAEPPDNITEAITEAERACKDLDGKPNANAVLTVDDLNGDGGEDWIADYSKLQMRGRHQPALRQWRLHLADLSLGRRTQWDLLFEDLVQSYKFGKSGGKPMLYVTTPGTPCNKPVSETCQYEYRLEKDAIVPVNP